MALQLMRALAVFVDKFHLVTVASVYLRVVPIMGCNCPMHLCSQKTRWELNWEGNNCRSSLRA